MEIKEIIEIKIKNCPVCNSEIKGNKKILFYCKKCNLLFKEEHIL